MVDSSTRREAREFTDVDHLVQRSADHRAGGGGRPRGAGPGATAAGPPGGAGSRGRDPGRALGSRPGSRGRVHSGAERPWPGHAAVPGGPGDRRRAPAGAIGTAGRMGVRRFGPARPGLRLHTEPGRRGRQTGLPGGRAGLDLGWSAPAAAQRRRPGPYAVRAAGHDRRGTGRSGAGHDVVPAVLGHIEDVSRPPDLPGDVSRPAGGHRPGPRAGPEPGRPGPDARPAGGPQRPAARARHPDAGPGLRRAGRPVRFRVDPRRLRGRAAGQDHRPDRPGPASAVPGQAGGHRLRVPDPGLLHHHRRPVRRQGAGQQRHGHRRGTAVPGRPAGGPRRARSALRSPVRPAARRGGWPDAGHDADLRDRGDPDRYRRRADQPGHRRVAARCRAAVRRALPRRRAQAALGRSAGGRGSCRSRRESGRSGGNHGPFGQKECQLSRTGRGATA